MFFFYKVLDLFSAIACTRSGSNNDVDHDPIATTYLSAYVDNLC